MNQPPKEFTKQEQIVAGCLDELGLRYAQQVPCGPFLLDFVIEGEIALEADGVFGHLSKKDRQRDGFVLESCYNNIVHIKSQTKESIMEEIKEKLCLV